MIWNEIKNLKLIISTVIGIIAFTITAYNWGDDLEDAQHKTQEQLDQLVKIVAGNVEENKKIHENHSETLTSIEQSLALMAQEIRLRRELEKEIATTQ